MAKILIADDEESVRDVLRRVMALDGHEIIEAADGEEAIRRVRDEQPAVALIDLFMPRKEGLETIMQIRRSFPDVKVIAMSGGDPLHGLSFLEVATRLGAHRALAKPFKVEEVRAAVTDLLRTASGPAESPAV